LGLLVISRSSVPYQFWNLS